MKSGNVGWTRKELIWLEAALTLPTLEFLEAIDQIASMSGRTISAVAAKARSLKAPIKPSQYRYPPYAKRPPQATPEPWVMIQPTPAQMMAGNSRRCKTRQVEISCQGSETGVA